jgi:hypothetical protein
MHILKRCWSKVECKQTNGLNVRWRFLKYPKRSVDYLKLHRILSSIWMPLNKLNSGAIVTFIYSAMLFLSMPGKNSQMWHFWSRLVITVKSWKNSPLSRGIWQPSEFSHLVIHSRISLPQNSHSKWISKHILTSFSKWGIDKVSAHFYTFALWEILN